MNYGITFERRIHLKASKILSIFGHSRVSSIVVDLVVARYINKKIVC